MSLLEALLLDPVRMDVWVAYRSSPVTRGVVQGTGTQSDPFTVQSAADFDALMNDTTRIPNFTSIHLGPGVFPTAGYAEGVGGGWRERALVEFNVIDLRLADGSPLANPLRHTYCKSIQYFGNSTPGGALIQGALAADDDPTATVIQQQAELTTQVDEALALAFL